MQTQATTAPAVTSRATSYRTSFGTYAAIESVPETPAPLVLLLHSMGTSKRMYENVIAELADMHCVAVDALGHGESDRPRYEYTVPDHGSAIIELVEQARQPGQPVILGGCSLGAIFGIEVAARVPRLVQGLLLNGCPGWHLESQRIGRLRTLTTRLLDHEGLPRAGVEMPGAVVEVSEVEHSARSADVQKCGRWLLSTNWAVTAYDIVPRLPRITAKTAVLMGEQDWCVASSYTLKDGIEGATFDILENAGHQTPFDNPTAIADAIRGIHTRIICGSER